MNPDERRYTCEETFRRLEDYVDRELSAEEMERVREHLKTCEGFTHENRLFSRFAIAYNESQCHPLCSLVLLKPFVKSRRLSPLLQRFLR